MMKKVIKVMFIVVIGVLMYIKGYNNGSEYGYISGFITGLKRGQFKELINNGHTPEDAIYILNNRDKDNTISEEELK